MSFTIPVRAHILRIRGILTGILTLALLLVCGLSDAHAQDRWQEIDLPFSSGFGSELLWPRPGSELFWLDSSIGYYYVFDETNVSAGLRYFKTTNAGAQWQELDSATPIPHRVIEGDLLLSPEAQISSNGGESWRRLRATYTDTNFFPDPELRYSITRSVAHDPQNITVLYQLYDLDDGTGDSSAFGPFRLAYSSDGGTNWRFYDSLLVFGEVLQELANKTRFGPFPAPESMTDTTSSGWWRLLDMPTDSTVRLVTKVFGQIGGDRLNVFYLGELNLRTPAAQWSQLPFSEPIFPPPATDLRIEALSKNVIWSLGARFFDVFNAPDSLLWTIWRTENGGGSWDTINVPSWIDFRSLRFVDERVGVSMNAKTFDGGRTWQPWTHPFERGGLFWAVDSSNFRHTNRFSFFGTSNDGGRNWAKNDAGGLPLDVTAVRGNVLAGRTYGSLLIGRANATGWTDPSSNGGLPSRTHRVWTAAYPDFDFDSNRVVAIATTREYDGTDKMVALESTTGGRQWSVVQDLEDFGYPAYSLGIEFAVDPDQEVRDPVGFLYGPDGLYVTENDGASWTFVNGDLSIISLTMINTQYGVAVAADGIYQTTNGGATFTLADSRSSAQSVVLGSGFGLPNSVGVMYSENKKGTISWSVEQSEDLGGSFVETSGSGSERDMDIAVFWGDSANVHTVGRYGVIQHSADAGNTFTVEKDSSEMFRGFVGFVAAGSDTGSIYIIGTGNTAGRFLMYWDRPASVRDSRGFEEIRGRLQLSSNPVRGDDLRVSSLDGTSLEGATLFNTLGIAVREVSVALTGGSTDLVISTEDLASGRYTLLVRTSKDLVQAPIAIIR